MKRLHQKKFKTTILRTESNRVYNCIFCSSVTYKKWL